MATDTEKSIANNPLEEKNPNKTLDTTVPPSTKPDRVEAPTNTAAPNVDSGVDVILKEGEDSKSTAAVVGAVAGNIGTVTDIQKKIRRAERFGMTVQLSEQEKRNSRAERFGTGPTLHGSEPSKKSEELKRKARAERFGLPVPSTGTEEEEKKKARLARFAPVSKTDTLEDDKRKARAIRFSKPPLSSITQVNGTGNVEPEAAIAGKAGGGV